MRRLLLPVVLLSAWAACQCGPGNLCESTRCGPGLTCDARSGRCISTGTPPDLTPTGGSGGMGAAGGSAGGLGTAGGDAEDGGVDCPMTCAGQTPVCDRSQGRCVACTARAGCSGATPVCNRLWQGGVGRCQVCLDDNSGCSGSTPFCDVTILPAAGCIGCRNAADCTTPGTTCDSFGTRTCVVDDGGFGGGGAGGGGGGPVTFSDGGVTARCLPGGPPPSMACTTECPRGFVCQGGRCVLRGSSGPVQVTLRFPNPEDCSVPRLSRHGRSRQSGELSAMSLVQAA
jgi:hypothetical protein